MRRITPGLILPSSRRDTMASLSAAVERVGEVVALEGCGLAGDRYCEGTGHWCPATAGCARSP
jgi:hypothetical protein